MPLKDSPPRSGARSPRALPPRRAETWNDTDAIARHRELSPSKRIALALEVTRAALSIAGRGGSFEPDRLVAALNAHAVEYVIVGDLAGAAHGVVRATDHVELALRPNADMSRFSRPHDV